MGEPPCPDDPDAARLRDAALRLAAELDGAGLYKAAAYAAMAADATSDEGKIGTVTSACPWKSAVPGGATDAATENGESHQ